MASLTMQNKKFYEDTYYDLEVRIFKKVVDNIFDLKGTEVENILELTTEYEVMNEYEELYIKIVKVMDKYCEHFISTIVLNKHHVGLPIFLQLKKEYQKDGTEKILNELKFIDKYPFLLLDILYKEDNSYPDELLPPVNRQYLFKQINNFYEQEIFNTNDEYFTKDGRLDINKISIEEYTKNHTELLRDDYQ